MLCLHMLRSRGVLPSVFMALSAFCAVFAVAAVRADVIDRLDALRGKGMARMYSWASKR